MLKQFSSAKIACVPFVNIPTSSQYLVTCTYTIYVWSVIIRIDAPKKCLNYCCMYIKVRKRTKIRNRYNQVPHLTQDINGKVTNSLLDIANESQEVSPFQAGDHKPSKTDAHESIANTCQTKIHKRSTAFE